MSTARSLSLVLWPQQYSGTLELLACLSPWWLHSSPKTPWLNIIIIPLVFFFHWGPLLFHCAWLAKPWFLWFLPCLHWICSCGFLDITGRDHTHLPGTPFLFLVSVLILISLSLLAPLFPLLSLFYCVAFDRQLCFKYFYVVSFWYKVSWFPCWCWAQYHSPV